MMMRRAPAALLAAAAAALAGGCSLITDSFVINDFSGDPFPIEVDVASGAILVGLREDGQPDRTAVLDVLSPVTLVDPGLDAAPSLGTADLTLLGVSPATGGFDIPRARFSGASLLSLHPCPDETCVVGPLGAAPRYDAIIGGDVLAGDALRLRLGDRRAFILADIGGADRDRTYVCDAVFPSPYRGGGTLVIADTEVSFGGRRVTLQACLGNDPAQPAQTARGADALLVMSTGIGVSMLSEPAYERYRRARELAGAQPPPPPLEALPSATVFLPSGAVMGRRATIDRLALAAASSSSPRAPCRQVFAHHLLLPDDCHPGDDCPCTGSKRFCAVPAVVELSPPTGLEVLVVSDGDATLQALRTELRPDQPEVDGILGTGALPAAEVDVDYPHNRVLVRCTAGTCVARPALAEDTDREQVSNCIIAGPK